MNIRKGDNVVVIAGKDKGFKGEVIKADRKALRVVVDGANLVKKHIRSGKRGEKGQRIELPASIDVSNVKLYCPKCKKGIRFGIKVAEDGTKKRTCKKCNNEI